MAIEEQARNIFDRWYFSTEPSPFTKRLDGYGLRLMIILAFNEGLSSITPAVVEKVVKLLDWQLEVRRELDPIDAESSIAKMEEAVRRALTPGPMVKRDLQRKVSYNRAGIYVWDMATSNLLREEEIYFDSKTKTYRLSENCHQFCHQDDEKWQ